MVKDEVTSWKCNKGHVLGQVSRNGDGIRRLSLFRQAMDPDDPGDPPDVIAVVEGNLTEVRCSICGGIRPWVEGEEALRALLEKTGKAWLIPAIFDGERMEFYKAT